MIDEKDVPTYYDLAKEMVAKGELSEFPYLVLVNNEIKELRHKKIKDKDFKFLYFDNTAVKQAYSRTAIFMVLNAAYNATARKFDATLKFSIKNGHYFEYDDVKCTDELVETINQEFDKIVNGKHKIEKESFTREAAMNYFKQYKMVDVELLFKYFYKQIINLRVIPGYMKYSAGLMLYDTSFIKGYKIERYKEGFILIVPSTNDVTKVEPFKPGDSYFAVQKDATDWTKKMKINTVGRINSLVASNRFDDLIIMTESYQDKQIGDIAEKIKASRKRIILIAGPSSSGKTSFANRLMYHLRALEFTPLLLSADNFFVEREDTPKDENGEYDFECIEALDTKLLNDTLNDLLEGKEVKLPTFDFEFGKKNFNTPPVKLKEDELIIIEGIHCLNPALTPNVEKSNLFRIYISALAEISLDNFNRISTSDLRLIRRMERDRKSRGYSIKDTILRWKSVRAGEEKNIFPYQGNADEFFNSSICYELNVLKTNVIPLLYEYIEDPEVGIVAKRLIKILNFFLGVYTEAIPKHSILREFLGGSILNVG